MSFSGLEATFATVCKDLKTPGDVLVLFIHWKLAKEGFLCTGSGSQNSSAGSELLPSGWNSEPTVYELNYSLNSVNFILKVVMAGDSAIVNLLRCDDNKNTDTTIEIKDHVSDNLNAFADVFLKKSELLGLVDSLVEPLKQNKQQDKPEEGKKRCEPERDPLRVEGRGSRPRPDVGPPGWSEPGYPNIGSSDLDPFGSSIGGGMLMDPRRGGGGGRLMEPRWDPVGPMHPGGMGGGVGPRRGGGGGGGLGGGGGGRRNFGDAMRPPGWDFDDNMYM